MTTSEEDAPKWVLNFFCGLCYYALPVVLHYPCRQSFNRMNEIRHELKLPMFDSVFHAWTTYPTVTTIGMFSTLNALTATLCSELNEKIQSFDSFALLVFKDFFQ